MVWARLRVQVDDLKRKMGMIRVACHELKSVTWMGPKVWIYRLFRDGKVTQELLPYFVARLKVDLILFDEPEVARAKIVHFGEAAPWGAV
jgi:hypothetical protein